MPAHDLQPSPLALPWPLDVPQQTDLQEHLHEAHWQSRHRIITALSSSFYPKHRKASVAMGYCGHDAYIALPEGAAEPYFVLDRCRHRMCPFCAQARSARVAQQIRALMRNYRTPRAIVLTQRSTEMPLRKAINLLRSRFHRLRKTAFWKNHVLAGCYTVEVTRNDETGLWHPHLHLVYAGRFIPQQELSTLWGKITGDSFIVHISAVHDKTTVSYELAKYIGKPQQVAEWPARAILEYATGTQTCRMLGLFGKQPTGQLDNQDPPPPRPKVKDTISLSFLTNLALAGNRFAIAALINASGLFPLVANWSAKHMPQLELAPSAESDEEAHMLSNRLKAAVLAILADGPPPPVP